jgi:hypothetical protein
MAVWQILDPDAALFSSPLWLSPVFSPSPLSLLL